MGSEKNSSQTFSANSLAGRHGAEAVGGDEHLDLGDDLEDDRDADRQFKGGIAAVAAGDADRADEGFHRKGHDALVRDAEDHVLGHGDRAVGKAPRGRGRRNR